MLREMDCVEGDWAALFWALGSATALFKHLEAPMSNLSDVLFRTRALMKKIRRRTLGGYAICFILVVAFGSFIFIFPNTLQQVGSGLTVAALGSFGMVTVALPTTGFRSLLSRALTQARAEAASLRDLATINSH
jgi:hypothetical protein